MFSFSAFIKKGLLDAVGKLADYQVILNAAGWHEKGVLNENDLAEISAKIDEYHLAGPEEVDPEESGEVEPSEEE